MRASSILLYGLPILGLFAACGGGDNPTKAASAGAGGSGGETATTGATSASTGSGAPICPGDGWCSVADMPDAVDVWGTSPKDVWVVGASGTVLRWDGTSWKEHAHNLVGAPTGAESIWGSSDTDVWIGGALAKFWHWDGKAWTAEQGPGPIDGMVSFAEEPDGTVWSVGTEGNVYRRDKAGWHHDAKLGEAATPGKSTIETCGGKLFGNVEFFYSHEANEWWLDGILFGDKFSALAGAGGDVWIGGDHAYHWDGARLTNRVAEQVATTLQFLAGTATDLWGVRTDESLVHWDGVAWKDMGPSGVSKIAAIAPAAGGVVRLMDTQGAVREWKGGSATTIGLAPLFGIDVADAVAFAGPDTAYLVSKGDLYTWQNPSLNWTKAVSGVGSASALWASSPTDLWIAGGNAVNRWDGVTLKPVALGFSLPANEAFIGLWGNAAGDVWLVGNQGTWEFDGTTFHAHDGAGGSGGPPPNHVAMTGGKGDAWLARNGVLSHFDGASWTTYTYGPSMIALGCTPQGDVIGIGSEPLSLTQFGAGAPMAYGGVVDMAEVSDASVVASDDVWVVLTGNHQGQIQHYDGAWKVSVDPLTDIVVAIWAFPGGDVFAVGNGKVFHRTPK